MWQEFFDSQASTYEENPFTKNTVTEVDFLLSLYPLQPGASILDVGCGTGRHSIELAKRGFNVTGLDLSEKMLEIDFNGETPARAGNQFGIGQIF